MASRLAPFALRAASRQSAPRIATSAATSRAFQSSARQLDTATAAPAATIRKPVGAFRGGLFGFLLGTSLAAYGTYYYILEDYRLSNEMLTEDIYALQAAVQRIHAYVAGLEEKVDSLQKKKL